MQSSSRGEDCNTHCGTRDHSQHTPTRQTKSTMLLLDGIPVEPKGARNLPQTQRLINGTIGRPLD